jgi:hypothetical protein
MKSDPGAVTPCTMPPADVAAPPPTPPVAPPLPVLAVPAVPTAVGCDGARVVGCGDGCSEPWPAGCADGVWWLPATDAKVCPRAPDAVTPCTNTCASRW